MTKWRLLEAIGVELEYAIVDRDRLDVRPIADALLAEVGGIEATEVELGDIAWSNELALHVIELKTNGPVPTLAGLGQRFQSHVGRISDLLEPMGSRLLPGGMHPWMDPDRELRLWPHENNEIYRTFDRIFGCRGHGWANLQSTHINLPFGDDDEFGRLHAAVRLVLPLLPGLAASSPFVDGGPSGRMDTRLHVYRSNAARVPSVTGRVVPEPVFTRRDYEDGLLQRIYGDLAPFDPEGVLRHEWVNARGCIARFDRGAIEIRLLDIQECPRADIAICAAVIAAVRAQCEERWLDTGRQRDADERELEGTLVSAIDEGDRALVQDRRLLDAFGYPESGRARLAELWQHLVEELLSADPLYAEWEEPLRVITREGCLARRITEAAGGQSPRPGGDSGPGHPGPAAGVGDGEWRDALGRVYERLADCLRDGELFRGA